jgi:hypothetical protein
MSAGSGASNLGYGDIVPNSNVNPAFVNVSGDTYAGGFGSNEIPHSSHSMRGASNNVEAASGNWPFIGGAKSKKRLRRRNNISKLYRMKRSMKRSASRRRHSSHRRGGSKHMRRHGHKKARMSRRMRKQRGGVYTQYDSNVPYTPGYALGGPLAPSLSALANPPIYHRYNNCQDNYNHYAATQNK